MNTILTSAYKGDIVSRLRNWRGLHLAHGGILFEEAADEIARLRLTDAEREAIAGAADAYAVRGAADGRESVNAATLRGLLERTGDCPASDNAADRDNGSTGSE